MDDVDVDKKVAGSIKEAIGKVTGNDAIRTEGEADKKAADHPEPRSDDPA